MKAKISYWNGSWWCRRMGITGQGKSPREAWEDYLTLYSEMVRSTRVPESFILGRIRYG